MKKPLAIVSVLMIAACSSSSGKQVDQSKMQDFTVGKSTVSDVQTALGAPQSQSKDSSGMTTLVYSYSHYQAHAESFVPFAGAFIGGHDAEHQTEIFIFGPDNKLLNMSQSSGQNNSNKGS